MKRLLAFALLASGAGCNQATPVPAAEEETMTIDRSHQPQRSNEPPIDHLARMKGVIRLHAAADYSAQCGIIDLPDDAFIPVDLNEDDLLELAVAYGRANCSSMGATGFSSTGGSLVQFWWAGQEGPVRMLAEAHMMGFTPGHLRIETLQHGSACKLPGAAGCSVTYRWATPLFGEPAVERRPGGVDVKWAFRDFERPPPTSGQGGRSPMEQLARMRAAVRQDVQLNYGEDCGPISVPDSAFHQVEITGDDFPELAVSLARATCSANAARFSGTGGPVVQFWHIARDHERRDGPIRLLLETSIRGFTPTPEGMVTLQHQASCPGDPRGFCRVTYRWHQKARHLDAVEWWDSADGPELMRFGPAQLDWVPAEPKQ